MHFSFPDGNAIRVNCHDSAALLAEVRQRLQDGRGFAIAHAIGILTTIFTAYTVTRLIVATWMRWAKPKEVPL